VGAPGVSSSPLRNAKAAAALFNTVKKHAPGEVGVLCLQEAFAIERGLPIHGLMYICYLVEINFFVYAIPILGFVYMILIHLIAVYLPTFLGFFPPNPIDAFKGLVLQQRECLQGMNPYHRVLDPLTKPAWWDPKQSIVESLAGHFPFNVGADGESYTTGTKHAFDKHCDSGLLTLCTHSYREQGFVPFAFSEGSEVACNKGFLWVLCEEVLVINTHMQASDDPLMSLGYGVSQAQQKQLEQLGQFVKQRQAAGQKSIVVTGDFNCSSIKKMEAELNLSKLSSNAVTHEDGCIDHVFVSHGMIACGHNSKSETLVVETESDHKLLCLSIPIKI
jgi:hypothetical protein